jgi:hypothetical protein
MNLEPQKTSEIRAAGGVARMFASLAILLLAALTILVVLDVIPRSAFAEAAGKTALVAGVCALAIAAIGFLSRR